MAKGATATSSRPRGKSSRRRAPRQSWLHRNAFWLLAAVVAVAGALMLLATTDRGSDEAGSGAFVGADLHSLVVDPNDPDRLFVGGHQAVSVSEDGGATWREVASLEDKDAMGWAFTDDAIYVSGHPGLNRSSDGGDTFTMVNEGLPDTDVHAFGAGGGVLYGASPAVGVFASRDAGDTWSVLTSAAGHAFFGRIVVDPGDEEHLFAADARSGVVESRDGGRSWQQVGPLSSATWMSATGDDLDAVVASGPAGAVRSIDGGRSWGPLELPDGALVAELGDDPNTIHTAALDGTTARLWISRDGGRTWSEPR